jgi:hypothetical protein
MNKLGETKKFLVECRIDKGFDRVPVDVCKLAE